MIRAQKATNQRIQILLTHSQQPVSRRMMKAYVHWFNSRSKTGQIETDKGDKKKRKRKVKKGPSKRTIIDLEEAKEDGDEEKEPQSDANKQPEKKKKKNVDGNGSNSNSTIIRSIETDEEFNEFFRDFI